MGNLYLEDFFKTKTMNDVMKMVRGDVFEYSTDLATYFYGNGELLISPAEESRDEMVYVVDDYGFGPILTEF